jgi:hypothetical protein
MAAIARTHGTWAGSLRRAREFGQKDGKTLTYALNGTTPDGKPRHDVLVYEKR